MNISLKNLHEATEQQVFDQVANHLLTQKRKSLIFNGSGCAYRGSYDLKCAAGCLISDEEYKIEFEGCSWSSLVHRGIIQDYHAGIIAEMQRIHDNFQEEYWESELSNLSTELGLEFKIHNYGK